MMTTRPPLKSASAAAVMSVALLVSGCIRIGAEPPEQLLSLRTNASPQGGQTFDAAAEQSIAVMPPLTPRAFDNARVAVRADATSFAYVKGAVWADTPRRMFGALLADTIAAQTGRLVVNPAQFSRPSNMQLTGALVDFSIDARAMQAVVTYDATLVSATDPVVKRRRFTATAPVTRIDASSVAAPLSAAANDVARQVADWIGKP